jgi:hypothetical protein
LDGTQSRKDPKMTRWGSSYFLHDTAPIKLVGGVGATTGDDRKGQLTLSFANTPELLEWSVTGPVEQLVVKWELAVQLVALIQVLLLQNKVLRNEEPELHLGDAGHFTVAASGTAPLVCAWPHGEGAHCFPPPIGEPGAQVELKLSDEVALQLVSALAIAIASEGTKKGKTR